jgi:uncharacterized protein
MNSSTAPERFSCTESDIADGLHGVKRLQIADDTYYFQGDTLTLFQGGVPYRQEYATFTAWDRKSATRSVRHVLINVANACNLHCSYCFADGGAYGGKKQLMSRETAADIVGRLNGYQEIGMITFFGGEPMLNFPIVSWISQQLRRKTKRFAMITNGTVLSDEQLDFLADHQFSLTISLDGPREIHDAQRGKHDLVAAHILRISRSTAIKLKLSCQISPEIRRNAQRIGALQCYFRSEFPGVPFFFSPICSALSTQDGASKENVIGCGEVTKVEIDNTFRALLGEQEAIISKGVTSVIGKILLRNGSDFYCEKCDETDTINFDVDGLTYPCHLFFGTKKYQESGSVNALLKTKAEHPTCAKCWARLLCKVCPGTAAELPSGSSEECLRAARMADILERIVTLKVTHPDQYADFVHNFVRVYRELHLV